MSRIPINYAYTKYVIGTLDNEGGCTVYFETNDDEDTGYPGKFAADVWEYKPPKGLELALKHCGVSRNGTGHKVFVTLDGVDI